MINPKMTRRRKTTTKAIFSPRSNRYLKMLASGN
jgi:hypothetical protein